MGAPKALQTEGEYREYPGIIRWIILLAVMLGTLMQVIDTSIVNVAIPQMMGNLGATLEEIGWVSTGYIIANVIVLPLTGWLSSRFGRRRYLAISMIIFTIASFFCGTSRTLNELIFFRVLQGIGGAALISTAQATIMEVFPPAQLGMVQAIFGIGIMVGPTVGPTLGGWITDNYSWPWIFFINLPIGAIAAFLTFTFVHDSKHDGADHGKIDLIGIMFLAIGLGCLQTVLEKGNSEGWFESSLVIWLSILSIVGMVTFVWWELRIPYPAVNLRVLKDRGLAAATAFGTVVGIGLFGGIFIIPVFLQQLRHYTAEQTGWIVVPGALATAVMMPVVGRLVNHFSAKTLSLVGGIIFIISMFMLRTITLDTGPDQLFWPLVLRGAAMGFLWVPLTLAALAGLKGKNLADGAALYNLSRQLGGSAGIAFLTTYVSHKMAFHRAFLVEHVSLYNPVALQRLHDLTAGLLAKGASLGIARQQALAIMNGTVQSQAAVMAYADAFVVIGIIFIFALPLLLFFRNTKHNQATAPVAAE
ncbi:MAG: DHA2 family efflux MFS transporter permease subunit [bacterium]